MNSTLRNLIAFALFATLFAQPAFTQQVQFTLVQVKAGKMRTQGGPTTELASQRYTVQVPYTENVTQAYTVEVPYTETETQDYEVTVPYTETVIGPDGKENKIKKTRVEKRVRRVPVKKTRTETRTKVVPVQRTRAETRIRKVPIVRQRSAAKSTQFPPANAKFAYVSGEEISSKEMKVIAGGNITILQLESGKTLSDLQRQILKPDLIVMTMPPQKPVKK